MDAREARKIAKTALEAQGITYDKLSAKTVSFSDLGRGSLVFAEVHNAKTPETTDAFVPPMMTVRQVLLRGAYQFCKDHGFSLEFKS